MARTHARSKHVSSYPNVLALQQTKGPDSMPQFNGAEFIIPFDPGPLGMELEEVQGCVVVRNVMEGGQASRVEQIKENTVVVGVEG